MYLFRSFLSNFFDIIFQDEDLSAHKFPEFERKVNESIKALGGLVFPKLNWSCPKVIS